MLSDEQIKEIGMYTIKNRSTVRNTAKHFNISKSTVHNILRHKLLYISPSLYNQVTKVLATNMSSRHVRGGYATKLKYETNPSNEIVIGLNYTSKKAIVKLVAYCSSKDKYKYAISGDTCYISDFIKHKRYCTESWDYNDFIVVDLNNIPRKIDSIVIAAYIHNNFNNATFDSVSELNTVIADSNGHEIIKHTSEYENNPDINDIVIGEIYKSENVWKFKVLDKAETFSLIDFLDKYQ